MQTLSKSRQRRLNIRLSQQEWERVKKMAANTTCRSISEYARQLLLDKPVRVFYRNQSFDDFEQLMIRLLADLEDHANKFDAILAHPVFKTTISPGTNPGPSATLLMLLEAQQAYSKKTEEIKEAIIKIADQCAPK